MDDIPPGMEVLPAPAQAATDNPDGPGEELPLRLIQVAVPTSKSSFFSNYEVFIAERRLSKGEAELIKLVYVFLPYQKRLSEYDLANAKVYKLRVIRDAGCDETLMQMTWPEGDQSNPQAQALTEGVPAGANGKNSKLACYRTTADDYQKAVSRGR
jgi:hypothetical protein